MWTFNSTKPKSRPAATVWWQDIIIASLILYSNIGLFFITSFANYNVKKCIRWVIRLMLNILSINSFQVLVKGQKYYYVNLQWLGIKIFLQKVSLCLVDHFIAVTVLFGNKSCLAAPGGTCQWQQQNKLLGTEDFHVHNPHTELYCSSQKYRFLEKGSN